MNYESNSSLLARLPPSTKRSLLAFFPDLMGSLYAVSPGFVDFVLPDDASAVCSYYTFQGPVGWTMYSPLLIVACCMGAIVGIGGCVSLRRRAFGFHWPLAFLFFGFMNIDAIFLHCIRHTDVVAVAILHWLDVLFTSLSSTNIFFAVLVNNCRLHLQPLYPIATCVLIVISSAIGEFLQLPFTAEVLYIGVTALAAGFSCFVLLGIPFVTGFDATWKDSRKLSGLLVASVGAGLFVMAPLCDSIVCYALHGHKNPMIASLANHITALPITFFGCDIGFVGLYVYLLEERRTMNRGSRQMPQQSVNSPVRIVDNKKNE